MFESAVQAAHEHQAQVACVLLPLLTFLYLPSLIAVLKRDRRLGRTLGMNQAFLYSHDVWKLLMNGPRDGGEARRYDEAARWRASGGGRLGFALACGFDAVVLWWLFVFPAS